jgi:hypothetical protein
LLCLNDDSAFKSWTSEIKSLRFEAKAKIREQPTIALVFQGLAFLLDTGFVFGSS